MNDYMELYKKYRPRTWSDLVGQDKIVKDLQSSVAKNRLPGVYLFSGPRGCGKTSTAFILAKAINCPNAVDGAPCNNCPVCKSIDANANMGVHYESMANNGSVADVRSIVDKSRRAADIRRPIWILDEVHNLSAAAFDALLIPIEAKNINSLFILCTTNVNKVPDTILSRLQHRSFQLVDFKNLGNLCVRVCKNEGISISKEDSPNPLESKTISKNQITQAIKAGGFTSAGGSVRDTLSALEAVLSTGETPVSYGIDLTQAVYGEQDVAKSFKIISDAGHSGYDPKRLAQDLLDSTRGLLMMSNGVESKADVLLFKDRGEIAKRIGNDAFSKCFIYIGEAVQSMTWTDDPQSVLELCVVKMTLFLKAVLRKNGVSR